ncbi:MAG: hypothetical protein K6F77_06515 [Lachnospiraceae bacterium]|nr:hypothetical protein [Lachnospiraceae bacterium]
MYRKERAVNRKRVNRRNMAIAVIVVFVLTFAAFYLHHVLSSRADSPISRGVVNELTDFNKDMTYNTTTKTWERNDSYDSTLGTKDNPFVVLEIVPTSFYSYFGYMIDGCQPMNMAKLWLQNTPSGMNNGNPWQSLANIGTEYANLDKCFADEHYYEEINYKGSTSTQVNQQYYTENWTPNSGELSAIGYYEYVGPGKGFFDYSGTYADNSGTYATGTIYRPQFTPTAQNAGSFIWVTTATGTTEVPNATVKRVKTCKNYNKYLTEASGDFKWTLGDREYTSRKDSNYYESTNYVKKLVCLNDFFTSCLQLQGKAEIENYSIVYKCIEPWEIAEHTDWIDKADLIYLHNADETGYNGSEGNNMVKTVKGYIDAGKIDADVLQTDYSKSRTYCGIRFGKGNAGTNLYGYKYDFTNTQNDISFDAAQRMFLKCNSLGAYEGNYAPIMESVTLMQCSSEGYDSKTVSARYLDFETLDETAKTPKDQAKYSVTGYNNNIYKFCLMESLMDQENFYNFFMVNPRLSTGECVIKIDKNGNGIATSHEESSADAALYWSPETFHPWNYNAGTYSGTSNDVWYTNADGQACRITSDGTYCNGTLVSDMTLDDLKLYQKYKFFMTSTGGLAMTGQGGGNVGVLGSAFMYNSNNVVTTVFGDDYISNSDSNTGMSDVNSWFNSEDAEDSSYDSSSGNYSIARLIEYLLKYKRNSGTKDGDKTQELKLKILEVEPCNDFVLNETKLRAYLPKATFKGTFAFNYMTTQEFNTVKEDLVTTYDIIYIGAYNKKHNLLSSNSKLVAYNESPLDSLNFDIVHIGDLYNGSDSYRTSGNDISNVMLSNIRKYAKSEKIMTIDSDLYYNYTTYADKSSNLYSLLNANAYRSLNVSLSEYTLKSTISRIQAFSDSIITVDTKPVSYAADSNNALSTTNLAFNYTIGTSSAAVSTVDKYYVQLYIDINGNGTIDVNTDNSEMVYDSSEANNYAGAVTIKGGAVDGLGYYYDNPSSGRLEYDLTTIKSQIKLGVLNYKLVFVNKNASEDGASAGYSLSGSTYIDDDAFNNITGSTGDQDNTIKILQITTDAGKENADKGSLEAALADEGSTFYKKTLGSDVFNNRFDGIEAKSISVSDFVSQFMTEEPVAGDDVSSYATFNYDSNGDGTDELFYYPIVDSGSQLNLDIKGTVTDDQQFSMIVFSAELEDLFEYGSSYQGNSAVAYLMDMSAEGGCILFAGKSSEESKSQYAQTFKDILDVNRFTDPDKSTVDKKQKINGDSVDENSELTYAKVASLTNSGTNKLYDNTKWKNQAGEAFAYKADMDEATQISRTNKGTITTYPYVISPNLKIAGTTAKTYQLNMNNADVTVWYCLAGDYYNGSSVSDKSGKIDDDFYDVAYTSTKEWTHSTYGISPNDGANNYYLYTFENTTYIGTNLDDFGSVADDEMELFVNALAACNNSKYTTPYVWVTKQNELIKNGPQSKLSQMKELELEETTEKFLESKSSNDFNSDGYDLSLVNGYKLDVGSKVVNHSTNTLTYRSYASDDETSDNTIVAFNSITEQVDINDADNDDVEVGGATATPAAGATETPEVTEAPTPTPVATPITLFEGSESSLYLGDFQGDSSNAGYNNGYPYNSSDMKGSWSENYIETAANTDYIVFKVKLDDNSTNYWNGSAAIFSSFGTATYSNSNYSLNSFDGSLWPKIYKDSKVSDFATYVNVGDLRSGISSFKNLYMNQNWWPSTKYTGVYLCHNMDQVNSFTGESSSDSESGSSTTPTTNDDVTEDDITNAVSKSTDVTAVFAYENINDVLINGNASEFYSKVYPAVSANLDEDVTEEKAMKGLDIPYTNKIYFSPNDAYYANGNIYQMKITRVNVDNTDFENGIITEKELTTSTVSEVFFEKKVKNEDGVVENKIFRFDAGGDGYFNIVNENFLTSAKEYFLLFNGGSNSEHQSNYNALRFEIKNKKAYSVTYMVVTASEEKEGSTSTGKQDDVFLFDLD